MFRYNKPIIAESDNGRGFGGGSLGNDLQRMYLLVE